MRKLIGFMLAFAILMLVGCGEQKKPEPPSLLEEMSGVWSPKNGKGLITLDNTEKKFRLVLNDTPTEVTVGAIDNVNHTVNLNITRRDTGKPGVWTVQEIWNQDKSAFHLLLTMHDGEQGEFTFVRKITTDDLNRLAGLYAPVEQQKPAPEMTAKAEPAQDEEPRRPPIQPSEDAAAEVPPVIQPVAAVTQPVAPVAAVPSFDCAKASSNVEHLICASPRLAMLDQNLAEAYEQLRSNGDNASGLKADQIAWRQKERDVCTTGECIESAYLTRTEDLEARNANQAKASVAN
jgi:uncharacterized protein YecT (DUF1311 family)